MILADERSTLVGFLDYLRESIVLKAEGISREEAAHPMVPSGTSLLGLVKHLTMVEVAWFQWAFEGRDVDIPSTEVTDDDAVESAVAAYRDAVRVSNEIVADCSDLDSRAARAGTAPERMTMRWLLVHMVEETGRHAGHADILREEIDGTVGR